MKKEKDPKVFLGHILESIERIEKYLRSFSEDDFYGDIKTQDAVIRRFQVIGEAVRHLTDGFKELHPVIVWKEMVGMRDKVVHDYFSIDLEILWDTVQQDLPSLKTVVEKLLKQLEK